MKKHSVKILRAAAIALSLFVVMDWMIGSLMASFYHHSKHGIFYRQIYCLTESNENILILGSSRAAHHYVPSILEDSLGMSCYNAGSDGMCIYYHYAILSSYLASGRIPKLVIYDVNDFELCESNGATFTLDAALDRLAPHYGEYKEIDSLFSLNGWKEGLKLKLRTYRYNSKMVQLIKCNLLPTVEDNGYEAVYGILPDSLQMCDIPYFTTQKKEDGKMRYFVEMIKKLKANKIPVILVYSPIYEKGHWNNIDDIRQIAKQYDIVVLDYTNNSSLMKPELFKDVMHLNNEGAYRFTRLIISDLKYKIF